MGGLQTTRSGENPSLISFVSHNPQSGAAEHFPLRVWLQSAFLWLLFCSRAAWCSGFPISDPGFAVQNSCGHPCVPVWSLIWFSCLGYFSFLFWSFLSLDSQHSWCWWKEVEVFLTHITHTKIQSHFNIRTDFAFSKTLRVGVGMLQCLLIFCTHKKKIYRQNIFVVSIGT